MQVVVLKILSYNLYKMLPRQETEFSNWHSTLIIADLYVVVIWLKLRFSIFFLNLEVLVSMNINWPNWYKKENKGETSVICCQMMPLCKLPIVQKERDMNQKSTEGVSGIKL